MKWVLAIAVLLIGAGVILASRRSAAVRGLPIASIELTNISTLLLWIDVSEATNTTYAGAPTNGSPINKIQRDLSPANHVTAISGAGTIIYAASGGGADGARPYLAFTNDSRAGTLEALSNTTSFTVGVVMKPLGEGDKGPFWGDTESATGAGATGNVDFNNSAPDNLGNDNAYNIANGADLESDVGSRSTNWQVVFLVSDGASSSIWLDSVQIKTGTVGTTFEINRGPSGFSGFGGTSFPGANWCSILFARGLVWGRALTSNEVFQASRRCMDDFGFP